MGAALSIRNDLRPEALRRCARHEPNRYAGRRMLAIANALEGMSQAMAWLDGMRHHTVPHRIRSGRTICGSGATIPGMPWKSLGSTRSRPGIRRGDQPDRDLAEPGFDLIGNPVSDWRRNQRMISILVDPACLELPGNQLETAGFSGEWGDFRPAGTGRGTGRGPSARIPGRRRTPMTEDWHCPS
jgi:hypothetical protein